MFRNQTILAEPVRRSLRAAEHRICLVIVLESFLYRVPIQLAFRFHGDMVQQACGAGPMPDLDWCNRLLTAPDAVEPVPVLFLALIEVNFVRTDYTVKNFR